MKRFKRWLIHKLGGICKDDIIQPVCVHQDKKDIQKIKAEFTTTFENISKEEVKKILLEGIYKELSTYYFEIKKQELNKCDVYSMELEFILQ